MKKMWGEMKIKKQQLNIYSHDNRISQSHIFITNKFDDTSWRIITVLFVIFSVVKEKKTD